MHKANLIDVPASVTDLEACFAEPLAAILRIVDQGVIKRYVNDGDASRNDVRVCVCGDGKMGLLCAEVLSRTYKGQANGLIAIYLIGKHESKIKLVKEYCKDTIIVSGEVEADMGILKSFESFFDVV